MLYILGKLNELDKLSDVWEYIKDHVNIIVAVLMIFIIIAVIVYIGFMLTDKKAKKPIDIDNNDNSNKEYLRSLPCKGDILIAYYILSKYNLLDYLSTKGNLIIALYLKWVRDGFIKVKSIDKKDGQAQLYIDESCKNTLTTEIENELYKITREAISVNDSSCFKITDLTKAMTQNNQASINLFKNAFDAGKKKLISLIPECNGKEDSVSEQIIAPYIKAIKNDTIEFRKYFIKIVKESNSEAFKVSDNYFIFANLLDLNDDVTKHWFSDKVNPDIIKLVNTNMHSYINEFIHISNVYSDQELKHNKKYIKKSEKDYYKAQKNAFLK